jgi:hypothetical protein
MEEFSVFIPFEGELNISTSLPVDGSFFDGGVERVHSKGPKAAFKDRERAFFFQEVKEIDQNAAVLVTLGKRDGTTGSLLTPKMALTKTGNNTARRVRARDRGPSLANRCTEGFMEPPRRFIAKNRASRNYAEDGGDERDMVRCVTGN